MGIDGIDLIPVQDSQDGRWLVVNLVSLFCNPE